MKAANRIVQSSGVFCNGSGNPGMGKLQHRGPAGCQEQRRLPIDLPSDGVRSKNTFGNAGRGILRLLQQSLQICKRYGGSSVVQHGSIVSTGVAGWREALLQKKNPSRTNRPWLGKREEDVLRRRSSLSPDSSAVDQQTLGAFHPVCLRGENGHADFTFEREQLVCSTDSPFTRKLAPVLWDRFSGPVVIPSLFSDLKLSGHCPNFPLPVTRLTIKGRLPAILAERERLRFSCIRRAG